jgi:hypothetical protein
MPQVRRARDITSVPTPGQSSQAHQGDEHDQRGSRTNQRGVLCEGNTGRLGSVDVVKLVRGERRRPALPPWYRDLSRPSLFVSALVTDRCCSPTGPVPDRFRLPGPGSTRERDSANGMPSTGPQGLPWQDWSTRLEVIETCGTLSAVAVGRRSAARVLTPVNTVGARVVSKSYRPPSRRVGSCRRQHPGFAQCIS